MTIEVLQILQEHDLLGKKGPNASTISSLSLSSVVEIAQKIEEAIRVYHRPVRNPLFCHSASLALGGGAIECSNIDCRLDRINKLSRFALMYSDNVYINSFFSGYVDIDDHSHLEFLKENLYDDLLIVHEIRPLLDRGYISFFSPEMDVCFACQAGEFLGESAAKRFSEEYKKLQEVYLCKMSVTCEVEGGVCYFEYDGLYPYLDHGGFYLPWRTPPSALIKRPRIIARLERGNVVPLSKSLIKELGLHVDKAHEVATNVINGIVTSGCLNTSFLTENDLHISLLNSLHEFPEIREKNNIALKHLTSLVPFVEDVALGDMVKLRQREEEAFVVYRQALDSAIGDFAASVKRFTEKDALELYNDVIAPSIATLDRKVNQAKRDLISKPLRSITGVVGAISFGILTGLVPQDMSNIAKAIGLLKIGADMIEHTMALGDKEDSVKKDQFYFLWKVKNKAK